MNIGMNQELCFMQLGKVYVFSIYGQDLIKGMAVIVIGLIAIKWINQVLEAIMIEDPRVLAKPRPVVYLMSLEKGTWRGTR